jgi:O-antigen/teichoic acid export membrane protein
MSTKQFLKNIFLNNTSQGLQFGSRWLFNLTLINVLDIKDYAVFSFVYSVSNILLAVIPFGSSIFLINEVKSLELSKNKFFDSILIAISLFVGLLSIYLILSPFLNEVKGWDLSIYGIVLGFVLSLNSIIFSYFKGVGNFLKELKAYIFFFVALLLFIAYLYFDNESIKSSHFIFILLIGINFIVFSTTLFSNNIFFNSLNDFKKSCSLTHLKQAFSERKYFGLQEIATAVYTQSGMLLLFYLLDTETYGYYRAMFVIISPMFLITVSLSQVVLNFLKSQDKPTMIKNFRKIQIYSFLIGLVIVFTMLLFKLEILQLIKVPFSKSINIAFIIVLATALMRFIFSNYEMLIIIYKKQKYRFYVVIIVAIINIILVFSLLPKYGIIGAVLTNFLSYVFLLIGLFYLIEKTLYINNKSIK